MRVDAQKEVWSSLHVGTSGQHGWTWRGRSLSFTHSEFKDFQCVSLCCNPWGWRHTDKKDVVGALKELPVLGEGRR